MPLTIISLLAGKARAYNRPRSQSNCFGFSPRNKGIASRLLNGSNEAILVLDGYEAARQSALFSLLYGNSPILFPPFERDLWVCRGVRGELLRNSPLTPRQFL